MRKICKMCSLCIIFILAFSVFFTSFATDTNEADENDVINETNQVDENNETNEIDELNELRDQKTEIEENLENSNEELSSVDEELTENLQKIQELDETIETTEQEMEEIETEISELETIIEEIESKLDSVTLKYIEQKELLDNRLIEMYETGNGTYLDLIVGSTSLSDFISSYYLISELTTYDMDLLELVNNEKIQIEDASTQLNEKKQELDEKKSSLQKKTIAVSNSKILRANYVSKLTEEEQNLQAQIDEYKNQIELIEAEIKSLAVTASFGEDYVGGAMQWPIYGYYTVTSKFGMRTHPITGVYKLHTGVDIAAPIGASFTAIADGIVVKAEYNTAYGNMVILDHGGGVQTLYAHGSEICVEVGQTVSRGDEVLKVGSTGYSTGAHAHFEVRIDGTPVDPLDYVSIPESD